MSGRLSTGLSILDRRLGGGIRAGNLVALVAPAEGQSELFLRQLVSTAPTTYVSLVRPAGEVLADFDAAGVSLDTVSVVECSPSDLASNPEKYLTVPEEGYVILDCMDLVETLDGNAHLPVLDTLCSRINEQRGVGVVLCLAEHSENLARRLTLHRADDVWQLQLVVTNLSIDNRLLVTKSRGSPAFVEPIKLKLTDRVSLDTSRDIA